MSKVSAVISCAGTFPLKEALPFESVGEIENLRTIRMKAVKATEQYLISCTAVILMYNVQHPWPNQHDL